MAGEHRPLPSVVPAPPPGAATVGTCCLPCRRRAVVRRSDAALPDIPASADEQGDQRAQAQHATRSRLAASSAPARREYGSARRSVRAWAHAAARPVAPEGRRPAAPMRRGALAARAVGTGTRPAPAASRRNRRRQMRSVGFRCPCATKVRISTSDSGPCCFPSRAIYHWMSACWAVMEFSCNCGEAGRVRGVRAHPGLLAWRQCGSADPRFVNAPLPPGCYSPRRPFGRLVAGWGLSYNPRQSNKNLKTIIEIEGCPSSKRYPLSSPMPPAGT